MEHLSSHEELGRVLRDARLKRHEELPAAARALHIRARYLEALEAGALEVLPGDAYVKGYLHRYAAHLALPPGEMLAAYERIGVLPQRRFFYIPQRISRAEHPERVLVFTTLVLALAGSLLWNATHAPARPVRRVMPPPRLAAHAPILAPDCLKARPAAWPPCYYVRKPLFSFGHPPPPRIAY